MWLADWRPDLLRRQPIVPSEVPRELVFFVSMVRELSTAVDNSRNPGGPKYMENVSRGTLMWNGNPQFIFVEIYF